MPSGALLLWSAGTIAISMPESCWRPPMFIGRRCFAPCRSSQAASSGDATTVAPVSRATAAASSQ